MRKMTTIFVCLLFLAATLGVSAAVWAKKPPKPPPPPPPTGTIYFVYNDGSGSTMWTMNADGSEKTELPTGSCDDDGWAKWGTVSRLKHGGHYWFVRFCGVEGTHPDGFPRSELFAVRDDNAISLQLTDNPLIQSYWYRRNLAWGVDDTKVSWGAKRWVCDPDCEIVEFGIYNATVNWDVDGNIVGLEDPVYVWDTGYACWEGRCHADMQHLDWSPDGAKMAYFKMSTGGDIYVVDLGASSEEYLTGGYGPQWSPDGNKIAFIEDDDLRTINVDGTGEQILVSDRDSKSWDERMEYPGWSPDSMNLVYMYSKSRIRLVPESVKDIYIIGADGSGKTCLTNDISDGVLMAKGWR